MIRGCKTGEVVQFMKTCMRAAGVGLMDAASVVGDDAEWLVQALTEDRPLPLERVATAAHATCADPMELFSRCVAEYMPETFAAIEPRLEKALTRDERLLVEHLRRWVGSSYLAGLSESQRSKLNDWLTSLRQAPLSTQSTH